MSTPPAYWPSCPTRVGGGMWIAHVIGPGDAIVDEAREPDEKVCRAEVERKARRWNARARDAAQDERKAG